MADKKKIKRALVSVFHKEGLDRILTLLHEQGVELLSTGGTQHFIQSLGLPCRAVEDLTGYPSILGGRVKTLHPKVFGGILARRDNADDAAQAAQWGIDDIDLVIVDLYPFANTVAAGASHADVIEKIDIGGISLIRAAAKNYNDVVIVASQAQYGKLLGILEERGAVTTLKERAELAAEAFGVSSHYDSDIFNYFASLTGAGDDSLRLALDGSLALRYGENPHQQGRFYGRFADMFDKLHGKEISYNNLLDIDAAVQLISEFDTTDGTTIAILKHNNACGCATRPTPLEAWKAALEGDPVSAFGGIVVSNSAITLDAAEEINKLFLEVIIAPEYTLEAYELLATKKNRIILVQKQPLQADCLVRSCLNGVLRQQADTRVETAADLTPMTGDTPTDEQVADLLFANKLVKHSKSNAIVLARGRQLLASGVGQTSRVDALKQAIEKARNLNLSLAGAVMASDAFFPFADCVEIAAAAGIRAIIQPGGSVRDNDSIHFCNAHHIPMVATGIRHFRH